MMTDTERVVIEGYLAGRTDWTFGSYEYAVLQLLTAYRQLQDESDASNARLNNEIIRLQAERDEARQEQYRQERLATKEIEASHRANKQLMEVEQERDRMVKWLTECGQHCAVCRVHQRTAEQMERNEWPECTCGLAALLPPCEVT